MDISKISFPQPLNTLPFERIQEEKTEEKAAHSPPSTFDPETLYTAIAIDLSASEIAAMNPQLLPKLAQYRKNDLFKTFEPWIAACEKDLQQKIQTTLNTLYLISLMNSTYHEITKELEKNISQYIPRTSKENFDLLIQNGNLAIARHPPKTLIDAENEVIKLEAIFQQINDLLMLFFYLEPENLEKIQTLHTYAQRPDGAPRFPNCEKHFSDFCLNLRISQNERSELRIIQKNLFEKISNLRKFIKASHCPSPMSEREKLYSNHEIDFWQAGVKIMELALRETFTKKRENRRFYLPDVFHQAVKRACGMKGFHHLNFHKLVENPTIKLDPQFILAVWIEYMGTPNSINDAADLMKLILSKLDQQQFQKLQNDLKTTHKRSELIYNTTKDFLVEKIRGNITYLSMKYWATKK